MSSAVMFAPSSVRNRFSSSTFRLNGSVAAPSTASTREDLDGLAGHLKVGCCAEAVDAHWTSIVRNYLDVEILTQPGSPDQHPGRAGTRPQRASAALLRPLLLQVRIGAHQVDKWAVLRPGHVQLAQVADVAGADRALRLDRPARPLISHLASRMARHSTWWVSGKQVVRRDHGRPIAELVQSTQVAAERGRVRKPRRRSAAACGRRPCASTSAPAPVRGGSSTTRSAADGSRGSRRATSPARKRPPGTFSAWPAPRRPD